MNDMPSILSIVFQLVTLGIFIALIYPLVKQENWKEKFWDNPNAKGLVITFIIIGFSILMFKLIMSWIAPIEVIQ